jgi:hypothetical protein
VRNALDASPVIEVANTALRFASRQALFLAAAAALGSLTAAGCFPTQAGPRLEHFASTSPEPGTPAPLFALPDLRGEEVRFPSAGSGRPLVLALGSETCPVFRHRRHWLHALERSYRERVDFLAVYTREAHPVGSPSPFTGEEWDIWVNLVAGVRVREPQNLDERIEQARHAAEALDLKMPVVVDRMDDAVWRAYGAASAPVFVIDAEGRVAERQVWSDPSALRDVLDHLLSGRDETTAPRAPLQNGSR